MEQHEQRQENDRATGDKAPITYGTRATRLISRAKKLQRQTAEGEDAASAESPETLLSEAMVLALLDVADAIRSSSGRGS